MTIHINLETMISIVTSIPFLVTVYVIGLIVSANLAYVAARRNPWGFMPQHFFCPILWPFVAIGWVLTLPARMIKD